MLGGLSFLAALTAIITRLLPHFYLLGEYPEAAAKDPLTPLPLPADELNKRTIQSLKLMFSQMLFFWTTLWSGTHTMMWPLEP